MASANLCNSGSPSSKTRSSLQGPVAIFWDIENCSVPSDVNPEDVAGNIRLALQTHMIIDGAITVFSAYGDFNLFPRRLREGCQRTGVKLVDVPNGRKDAADKAILVDMFLFALDNRPPSSIMLISGDVDFAPVLHIFGQRGYTIILVIPSGVGISSALSSAGRFLWDWPSMARGKEFVPQPKISTPHGDISGFPWGCQTTKTIKTPGNEEERAIAYKGILRSNYNTNDSFMISESIIEHNDSSISSPDKPTTSRLQTSSSSLNEVSGTMPTFSYQKNLQPGDVNQLKGQIVKLVELSGGHLLRGQIHAQYLKTYGRPLCTAEYGASKLEDLLGKMTDKLTIEGDVLKKCFGNSKFSQDSSGLNNVSVTTPVSGDQKKVKPGNLNHLKGQLVKLLELSGGHLQLGQIRGQYLKTYGRPLCMAEYGASKLKDLLLKMNDKLTVEGEVLKKCLSNSKFTQDPSGLNKASATMPISGDQKKVKPRDLNRLKGQLVKLLELSGGHLLQSQIYEQYLETYGKPLYISKYGANKLKDLLGKMTDKLTVEGKGPKKRVCLSNSKFIQDVPSINLSKENNKGKEKPRENIDVTSNSGFLDEYLCDEKVVVDEHLDGARRGQNKVLDQCLNQFKHELKELLLCYSGKIFLNCLPSLYQQMYKRPLDYQSYGVVDLDKLLAEVRDVAVLQEDPTSKIMYLAVVGC